MMTSSAHRIGAFACAVTALGLAVASFAMFVTSYPGQAADDAAMKAWAARWGNEVPTTGWLGTHQLILLVVIGVVIGAACAWRRSTRLAAHAAAVILGAVLTAVFVKHGLDRPSFGVGTANNSFPSNTVAAFVAAGIALVVVLPNRFRTVAAVGATVGSVAVSAAVVALQWHRPSDVIGGWLIAIAAAAAAECLVPVRGRRVAVHQTNPGTRLHTVRS
ncbi:phosphatase PAP2 family protein [Gordonia sp. PDNC005]|uniref:phosphatase PAP2 family protein n=1 Tax=unclassified Gordonia (in: high G+C Gram-positive bacteria) TaxID=2657482 RepID=UPI00196365C7|nr:phosphatase PAP2 family protein [Gordonia sp. PDNC005]QRY63655.1 phosphatase PAP2 family protein [Gordonia sp. PDNC005]